VLRPVVLSADPAEALATTLLYCLASPEVPAAFRVLKSSLSSLDKITTVARAHGMDRASLDACWTNGRFDRAMVKSYQHQDQCSAIPCERFEDNGSFFNTIQVPISFIGTTDRVTARFTYTDVSVGLDKGFLAKVDKAVAATRDP
jgi:hypothetical protein